MGTIILLHRFQMQLEAARNRPWALTGPAGGMLRVGSQKLALADVCGVELSAGEERDFQASLLNAASYLVVAGLLLVLVVQVGWRERFLLATVFFMLICVACAIDIFKASPIRLYRLRILRRNGPPIDFTTADAAEAEGLLAVLRLAGRA